VINDDTVGRHAVNWLSHDHHSTLTAITYHISHNGHASMIVELVLYGVLQGGGGETRTVVRVIGRSAGSRTPRSRGACLRRA